MKEVFHVPLITAGNIKLLVDGGNVQYNELVNVHDVGESSHHDSSTSHAVTSQAYNLKIKFLHEAGEVRGHQTVGHFINMRTVSVIPRIYGNYPST